MRRSNSMTETFADYSDASALEAFFGITMTIASMAVGAGVCSGIITLALMP
jgi:hypothetical protein